LWFFYLQEKKMKFFKLMFAGTLIPGFAKSLLILPPVLTVLILNVAGFVPKAVAHFGMVIPSDNMVMPDESRTLDIQLSFSHPFEMVGMPLVKPKHFFVVKAGERTELGQSLEAVALMGQPAWRAGFAVKRPGAYAFVMEPEPYWEPAEDCFIVHYTKTVVAAFGDDEGWDEELGLKTEIVALSKPFGLYRGNVFQGVVKLDGRAVPGAEVEVEYYNQDKRAQAPSDYMVTQTIKADQNGVFTYAVPASGWWGFAALTTSDKKMMHKTREKDIELGAVLWVKFERWQEN
jgi:cobalt/nickel transport protein